MYDVVSACGEGVVQCGGGDWWWWCGGVESPGGEGGIIYNQSNGKYGTKEKAKKVFGGEGGIIYILIADRASTGR